MRTGLVRVGKGRRQHMSKLHDNANKRDSGAAHYKQLESTPSSMETLIQNHVSIILHVHAFEVLIATPYI